MRMTRARSATGSLGAPARLARLAAAVAGITVSLVACGPPPATQPPPAATSPAPSAAASAAGSAAPSAMPAASAVDDGASKRATPALAVALVLDRSGSMSGQPLKMAKAAATGATHLLDPTDYLEVIAFDSSPTRIARTQSGHPPASLGRDIGKLITPGGGTEFFSALDMAYRDLAATAALGKHVLFLTDGQGPTEGLSEVVKAMFAEAITLSTVGLGSSTDDTLLQALATAGGGRFHKVTDPATLPAVFAREIARWKNQPP